MHLSHDARLEDDDVEQASSGAPYATQVMIWDDHQGRCIGELTFKSQVGLTHRPGIQCMPCSATCAVRCAQSHTTLAQTALAVHLRAGDRTGLCGSSLLLIQPSWLPAASSFFFFFFFFFFFCPCNTHLHLNAGLQSQGSWEPSASTICQPCYKISVLL